MRNERTPQEILLAFYLAKFCSGDRLPQEVSQAGFDSVTGLIDAFFARLGNLRPYVVNKRTPQQFRNGVLGLRNGDFKEPSKPLNQFLGKYQPIISRWHTRPSEEVWAELVQHAAGVPAPADSDRQVDPGVAGGTEVHPSPSIEMPGVGEGTVDIGKSYSFDDADRREAVLRQIQERRGQAAFRGELRQRYRDQCQITGTSLGCVLEAAHIDPYRGEQTNHADNGLLLRADIHTLFDLDLLGIEPLTMRIELHPDIRQQYHPHVKEFLLCEGNYRPSRDALARRFVRFQKRCESPVLGTD